MFLSLLYRLAVYCETHSGSKTLQMREKADCTTVDDMVNKESWRESNAYHKEKPASKDGEKKNVSTAGFLTADSDSNSDSNSDLGSRYTEIHQIIIKSMHIELDHTDGNNKISVKRYSFLLSFHELSAFNFTVNQRMK